MSINFNFTPDLSTYEARLKVARTKLAPKIDRLASEKFIFGANDETNIPKEVVMSPILANLVEDFKVNKVTGLAVLRTRGGMGKTTAARIILRLASRGLMFHGANSRNPVYWRNVAENLGLPADISNKDTEWIQVLVETVARGYNETEELSFLDKMIRGCCTLFDTTVGDLVEQPCLLPDEVEFNPAMTRAAIIFDDFNRMTNHDLIFFEQVYRVARGIDRVYCVVMTQDATIANALIDMNAWIKLNPLQGCYVSSINPLIDDVPQDTGHYPHPTWAVAWTLEELQALVVSRYDDQILGLVQIRAGMSPSGLLKLCDGAEAQLKTRII